MYVVNTADGQRTPMLLKQRGQATVSPSGKYALYFRDNDWYLANLAGGQAINLTKAIKVPFYQEDNDSPDEAGSWGTLGFTRDEKFVLLYDHYDIWQVGTDGSGGANLTEGVGRKNKLIFRYARLDPPQPGEPRGIDTSKPLLLSAVSEWSREEGLYRDRFDGGAPERLLWANKSFGGITKAKD